MAIYDTNWKSWCMYAIATVESNRNWSAVNTYSQRAIGVLQWANSRSYTLLKRFYDNSPQLFTLQSLIQPLQSGTNWGSRMFTGEELNEIVKVLQSNQSKAFQKNQWDIDISNDINNVLNPMFFPDTKEGGQLAMMAEQLYWLCGDASIVRRAFDNCGGVKQTTMPQILYSMNNLPTYGKSSHGDRHEKAYKEILGYDGTAGKDDFGWVGSGTEIPLDGDNRGGTNTDKILTNPTEDDTQDPVTTVTVEQLKIYVRKMLKRGNMFHLIGGDSDGKNHTTIMMREGVRIYTPNNQELTSGSITTSTSVPYDPPTPEDPNKKPQKPVVPGDKTGQGFAELANSYVGKITYVWGDAGGDRFSLDDGIADCSSFVCSVYREYVGTKLVNSSGGICSYTGNMTTAGKYVADGSNGSAGVKAVQSKLTSGDIIIFWKDPAHASAHVVIYGKINNQDRIIHCWGTGLDTVNHDFDDFLNNHQSRPNWVIRRLF